MPKRIPGAGFRDPLGVGAQAQGKTHFFQSFPQEEIVKKNCFFTNQKFEPQSWFSEARWAKVNPPGKKTFFFKEKTIFFQSIHAGQGLKKNCFFFEKKLFSNAKTNSQSWFLRPLGRRGASAGKNNFFSVIPPGGHSEKKLFFSTKQKFEPQS